MITVLHILDRITGGGPTRALVALINAQKALGIECCHRVLTLQKEAFPLALIRAKQAGAEVVRQPDDERLAAELRAADIVQLNFWNTPAVYEFMAGPLPPLRLALWIHVFGQFAPQVVTPEVVAFADHCVATSSGTLALPAMADAVQAGLAASIPAPQDFSRLADLRPRSHDGFNVGYVGTVAFSKLHPSFIPMCAAVDIPDVQFIVCGSGDHQRLAAQASTTANGSRFHFRGFVEDIRSVYEILDVFGYPLRADTYAAAELSLQEAMYAGVPPVVFPHGGVAHLVENGETGIVVKSEEAYTRAIEFLYHNPDERRRLGRNAHACASQQLHADSAAYKFDRLYARMMDSPKRSRCWPIPPESSPSARFAAAMGSAAPQFARSLAGMDAEADQQIAESSTLLASGEGGIVQYRNRYPDDPFLRYWSALVLSHRGRRAEARAELAAASALGLPPERSAFCLQSWERSQRA